MMSPASMLFSLRTFIAAMLALYISYQLDLDRPTWAFITVYIISAPLLGMVRSKALYRICGTVCGAVFSVIAVPHLVDAPELLVLAIAIWIGGCLYLSIMDGSPRSYAFILSGYTVALIGFPSVNAPQAMFDTALSRTEEIGLAIVCVQLMSYLPFNQKAGDVLRARIDQWLLDARKWALDVLTFHEDNVTAADRSQLMIDALNFDALRIHARYDTTRFRDIEGWIIRLQRHIQDFFADLVTLEAQIGELKATDHNSLQRLQPIIDGLLDWIGRGGSTIPQPLWTLLRDAANDPAMHGLIKSGVVDTMSDLIVRRSECIDLREKIAAGIQAERNHIPLAHHVDHRQAALYSLCVGGLIMLMSTFWIQTGWPEGGVSVMLASVVCCFFASLEAPVKVVNPQYCVQGITHFRNSFSCVRGMKDGAAA